MINVYVETNLGTVSKDNALWLRNQGRTLLRRYARDELRTQAQLRGRSGDYITAVDNSRSKSIDKAERIIIIDFTEGWLLNVTAIIARISDLIYRVTSPPLKTQPKVPGVLGDGWRANVRKRGKGNAKGATGNVTVELGDTVRFLPAVDYAAPLTATVAKGRLKSFVTRKARRGKIAGNTVHVESVRLAPSGAPSVAAFTLRQQPSAGARARRSERSCDRRSG